MADPAMQVGVALPLLGGSVCTTLQFEQIAPRIAAQGAWRVAWLQSSLQFGSMPHATHPLVLCCMT